MLQRTPSSAKVRFRRGCSSMVEQEPSKLKTGVRFPSPAPACCAASTTALLFLPLRLICERQGNELHLSVVSGHQQQNRLTVQ
jgi:hypothetical protein